MQAKKFTTKHTIKTGPKLYSEVSLESSHHSQPCICTSHRENIS